MYNSILRIISLLILVSVSQMFPRHTEAFSMCEPEDGKIIYRHLGAFFEIDTDGGGGHWLPHTEMIYGTPALSPSGDQFAFMSGSGDGIYIMDADGSNFERILDLTTDAPDPNLVWSHDGTQLAFEFTEDGWRQVFVVDVSGENLRQLVLGREYYYTVGEWSPDGTQLSISNYTATSSHISVIDLESGDMTDITLPENGVYDYLIGWMPDGQHFLFNSNRTNVEQLEFHKIDLTNSEIEVIGPFAASASWSPDKSQLAYIFAQNTAYPNKNILNIFILNPQNGETIQVTSETDALSHENYPTLAWSPDDTQLAFESWIDGNYEIFKINVDGTEMTRLTFDDANDTDPIWRPCLKP